MTTTKALTICAAVMLTLPMAQLARAATDAEIDQKCNNHATVVAAKKKPKANKNDVPGLAEFQKCKSYFTGPNGKETALRNTRNTCKQTQDIYERNTGDKSAHDRSYKRCDDAYNDGAGKIPGWNGQ